jgi:hypothetical protein
MASLLLQKLSSGLSYLPPLAVFVASPKVQPAFVHVYSFLPMQIYTSFTGKIWMLNFNFCVECLSTTQNKYQIVKRLL